MQNSIRKGRVEGRFGLGLAGLAGARPGEKFARTGPSDFSTFLTNSSAEFYGKSGPFMKQTPFAGFAVGWLEEFGVVEHE